MQPKSNRQNSYFWMRLSLRSTCSIVFPPHFLLFSPFSPIFFPLEARIGCYMQVPMSRSFKTAPSIYFRDLPCLCSHLQLWFLLHDGFFFEGGGLHHIGEVLSDVSDKLAMSFFRVTLNLPLLTHKPYSSVLTLLTDFSLVGGSKGPSFLQLSITTVTVQYIFPVPLSVHASFLFVCNRHISASQLPVMNWLSQQNVHSCIA